VREAAGPDCAPPGGRDRPAEAAARLPWLCPSADSLAALARPPDAALWGSLRNDPGAVLLLLRAAPAAPPRSFAALLHSPTPLEEALLRLAELPAGVADWAAPVARPIYEAALRTARLAEEEARRSGEWDADVAWVAGLLAPLGWLAVCAADPAAAAACLSDPAHVRDPAACQRRYWGMDQDAVARRLARAWGLPSWLTGVAGNLALPEETAHALGAAPALLRTVRSAAANVGHGGADLGLLPPSSAALRADVDAFPMPSPPAGGSPYGRPLLRDLLTVAAENRRLKAVPSRERLEEENDVLRGALAARAVAEGDRLRARQLEALAEFAAGAGHEINNPLAVILGQAQYLQAHADDWFMPDGGPHARKALQAVIAQTRRVHGLLRDLMQFARPAPPSPAWFDLPALLGEVAAGLGELAGARRVRLELVPRPDRLAVFADRGQVRLATACLLRNAVESAPPDGWARVRLCEPAGDGAVEVAVEDSGPGPDPADHDRLFDPFFSGRTAGRGRGLGLPTAWRLARLHGGDVRLLPPVPGGPTRFLLLLPRRCPTAAGGGADDSPALPHAAEPLPPPRPSDTVAANGCHHG
jgi:signal transduction histidine kinase